jgi:DUF4097 and DUF4098 domain-containing protein YvlB
MPEEKWLIEGEKVIDLGHIRRLKVSLVAGQVDIIAHDEPTTRVEVHSVRGKGLKVVAEGDSLVIDHPQLSWDNFIDVFKSFRGSARADVSVMVPRAVALTFGVVSANALISGLTEDAEISTVSGAIVVDGVRVGTISANTVTGELTVSGDVTSFNSDGVSGDVFLDATGVPDKIMINTVTGDVTTRLAPGVAAQYKINTVGGRINLDDGEVSRVRGGFTGRYGSLDKSWTDFRANTVSGNVSVLHAVTA